MTLTEIKDHADRLRELLRGLSVEVRIWKANAGPLLALERNSYLGAILAAVAGLDARAVAIDVAMVRVEDLARYLTPE